MIRFFNIKIRALGRYMFRFKANASTDNTLYGSSRAVKKGILFHFGNIAESSVGGLTYHVFNFEDLVAH